MKCFPIFFVNLYELEQQPNTPGMLQNSWRHLLKSQTIQNHANIFEKKNSMGNG